MSSGSLAGVIPGQSQSSYEEPFIVSGRAWLVLPAPLGRQVIPGVIHFSTRPSSKCRRSQGIRCSGANR